MPGPDQHFEESLSRLVQQLTQSLREKSQNSPSNYSWLEADSDGLTAAIADYVTQITDEACEQFCTI